MSERLTTTENAVIGLLFECLKGDLSCRSDLGSEADPRAVASIIVSNGILLTVYKAISRDESSTGRAVAAALREKYYASVFQSVAQDNEGSAMLNAFENAGMDCIPLKGWVLRKLYPDYSMRSMADLDILFRDYRYGEIKSVMTSLGFAGGGRSSWKHDNYHKTDSGITVELHKRLTDDSGKIAKWEKTIWSRALPEEGKAHVFRMSNEDFYLFHIIHMHKDMLNGHIGLRRIADTWLYLNAHPEMDRAYTDRLFEEFGMLEFARRMEKLASVCAGEAECDEASAVLLHYACTNGIYGTEDSYKLSRAARMSDDSFQKGKLRSVLAAVFLPYSRMKAHFPILQKLPFLLPFCWLIRLFRSRRGVKSKLKKLDYSGMSEEDFRYMQKLFKAAGIR